MSQTYPTSGIEYGTIHWLRREVGGFSGLGFDYDTLNPEMQGKVDSFIQSGLQQFYYPPPLGEGDKPHTWTFLWPLSSLDLVADQSTYRLPDDFAGGLEDFTFLSGSATQRIPVVDEAKLRQLPASESETGTPRYAAVRVVRSDGASGQQYEVQFYPTPTTAATLEYKYTISPPELSEANPHPIGGRQNSEVILQSCLAVAEERHLKTQDVATARWMERLAAAVNQDKQSLRTTEDSIWPFADAPDGLLIDLAYIRRRVGMELKYGPHPATWTRTETELVNEAIRTGLRNFYHPPVLPGQRYPHEWSFLQPVVTLSTVASQFEYTLPPDFGSINGSFTYEPGTTVLHRAITEVSEHQIRARRQETVATGRPTLFAIRSIDIPDGQQTAYQALLWPVPDQSYLLHYRYTRNPDALSLSGQIPAGGQPHAETILESCLASAESLRNAKQRPHNDKFLMRLIASVGQDQMNSSPDFLGRDTDGSDLPQDYHASWHDHDENIVTYNGAEVT